MSGFTWVDTAWNSLCGFCVREVFERKHEREKEKNQPRSAVFANCYLPVWSLKVIAHQENRISRTRTTTGSKERGVLIPSLTRANGEKSIRLSTVALCSSWLSAV